MKRVLYFLFVIALSSCQDFAEELSGAAEDNLIATRAAETELQEYYWYQGEKIYLTILTKEQSFNLFS